MTMPSSQQQTSLLALLSLSMLLSTGCRQNGVVIADDGPLSQEGEVTAPLEPGSGAETSDDSFSEDEGNSGWDGTLAIRQGPWSVVSANFSDDPCGWESVTSDNLPYLIESFLPSSFEVDSFDGGFEIEAVNYNTRGPIICPFEGSDFSCETQVVRPFQDWEYEIDFEGRVVNDEIIVGTAVVSLETDSTYYEQLQAVGVDPDSCTISVSLELKWGNF